MARAITISTHNGGGSKKISIDHNRRKDELVEKENKAWALKHPGELRIDPEGQFEIWHEEKVRDAYKELFGQAIEDYNARQISSRKPERVIKDYLNKILAEEGIKKNSVKHMYEIIYAVGSMENSVDDKTAYEVLKDISLSFQERHPHLHVVGIYFHNDEVGVPHVHLDYIPVCTENTRGPSIQNSLAKALKQEGFQGTSSKQTAQMAFEKNENDLLEKLMKERGYEVVHPQRGGDIEHLSIEAYKLKQEIKDLREEINKTQNLPLGKTIVNKSRLEELENMEAKYKEAKRLLDKAEREKIASESSIAAYNKARQDLEEQRKAQEKLVNKQALEKAKMMKEAVDLFFKDNKEMRDQFEMYVATIKGMEGLINMMK